MKTFSVKSNCRRTARKSFGPNSVEGVDFTVGGKKGAWFYEAMPVKQPVPKKARVAAVRNGESKADRVVAMLMEPKGASANEIAATMGWQKHTCRGLISGTIKKKMGLPVSVEKIAGRGTVYRIAA